MNVSFTAFSGTMLTSVSLVTSKTLPLYMYIIFCAYSAVHGYLHINISGCEKMKLKVKIRISGTIRKHPIIFTTTQRDT